MTSLRRAVEAAPAPTGGPGTPAVCVLGAPGDTGNLGVTALLHATLAGLEARVPGVAITVFDNGFGVRQAASTLGERRIRYRLCGLRVSRRLHRRESLVNVRLSSRLGGLRNPVVEALAQADGVLDLSGGDSFTDLYGERRYRAVTSVKQLVLEHRRPLVLLPQTYGPFSTAERSRHAAGILRRATMAWARDAQSYERLKALLGAAFDAERHRAGVDVAFGLPSRRPDGQLDTRLRAWLSTSGTRAPVVGVNVSGLLLNDPASGSRFGLSVDYGGLMRELVRRLAGDEAANVVLVPHVTGGGWESDDRAVAAVLAAMPPELAARIAVVPPGLTPGEVKWIIGRLDWFCGTRMHSTIAALSSGVPAAAVAYSVKTRGVFDTCGMGGEVVDARRTDDRTAVARLLGSWTRRRTLRAHLGERMPPTIGRASSQMDAIVGRILADRGAAWPPVPDLRERR